MLYFCRCLVISTKHSYITIREIQVCMYAYWIMWRKWFLHKLCTIDGLSVNLECDNLCLYRIILQSHIILKKYGAKIIFNHHGLNNIISSWYQVLFLLRFLANPTRMKISKSKKPLCYSNRFAINFHLC